MFRNYQYDIKHIFSLILLEITSVSIALFHFNLVICTENKVWQFLTDNDTPPIQTVITFYSLVLNFTCNSGVWLESSGAARENTIVACYIFFDFSPKCLIDPSRKNFYSGDRGYEM